MKNKVVAMTINEIEKSSSEFKNTHKIKESGPYDDEAPPKWFTKIWDDFIKNQFIPLKQTITSLQQDVQNIKDTLKRNNIK